MSTPHNEASKGMIAKTVLMPGDPLRAKYVAEHYLKDSVIFNTVRGNYGYTGTYKGKKISVMASGMGMPSMGIYSHELYTYYDVDTIIRIGSCGAFSEDVHVYDLILVQGTCTDSNYASQFKLPGTYSAISDFNLLSSAQQLCQAKQIKYHVGNVVSSDFFYHDDKDSATLWKKMGVLAVEMESYALFINASYLNKKAFTILTVSDHLFLNEDTTPLEREQKFTDMMEIALEIAYD